MLLRNVRRVHHIQRLTLRNLEHKEVKGPINVFYTLTLDDDNNAQPFYTSEMALETLNPSWDSIRVRKESVGEVNGGIIPRVHIATQLATKVIVRIYAETQLTTPELRQDILKLNQAIQQAQAQLSAQYAAVSRTTLPPLPPLPSSSIAGKAEDKARAVSSPPRLLLECKVDVIQLEYLFPPKQLNLPKLPSNTILLYMTDGVYGLPSVKEFLESPAKAAETQNTDRPASPRLGSTPAPTSPVPDVPADQEAPPPPPPPPPPAPGSSTTPAAAPPSQSFLMGTVAGAHLQCKKALKGTKRVLEKITVNDILTVTTRLFEGQTKIKAIEAENAQTLQNIQNRLEQVAGIINANRAAKARAQRLAMLEASIKAEKEALAKETATVANSRKALGPQAESLKYFTKFLNTEAIHLTQEFVDKTLYNTRIILSDIKNKLAARRRKLLHQLASIYPITPVADATSPDQARFYTIRGLRVSLSPLTASDDELISTALSYVVHLVFMLSKYLEVPLRYRLVHRGSRSAICDDVISFAEYPLFARGVEENRFVCGVKFLHKNILQILQYRTKKQLPSISGLNILQNLNELMEAEIPR